MLISYADPYHNHRGVIYQATNFLYIGTTSKDKLYVTEEGRSYHSRALRTTYNGKLKPFAVKLNQLLVDGKLKVVTVDGKHCYVMPFTKKLKLKYQNLKKPYPKT